MKIFITSALALSFISPVFADDVIKWETTSQTCWKSVYKEEYVPGTRENPGYVTSSNEYIEVPCEKDKSISKQKVDNNDCTDGKIAGALLGGGAGAAMSRGDGRWWAIPLGAVVGSKIGCDIDGG
jgi:hypothetical protein|tara:strand:+ start:129 stop:503 length:375 start_codon:yes stop_codon:yes gene_type:complete